ncbi:hypothetical protein TCAL_11568 [Tigriopus californicus]|uniref:Exonuclease domain-containing protein n=1 Tax=Tigriopus californicus TaxID=6832 RepID=A0A553NDQ7_TIGCA|nr:uncharacterized protein LOC131889224 [Tigriopus californicus]TRY63567.1 hypothetical protein TCAL_11568 [Tigriopus californicus]|eukprot:TCALIF_11568-PA protein Name:"Similar to Trex1 Three-prime repair exonuclease 1 (Mus musculus)" AED:0.21 eAED:0.21 QI:0/-1/0/1/-1/1/1/0/454
MAQQPQAPPLSPMSDGALRAALAQLMSPERIPPINEHTRAGLQRRVQRDLDPRAQTSVPPAIEPEPVAGPPQSCVQTLVFFDLEATGLRGSRPRITELALVAIHVTAFRDFQRTLSQSDDPSQARPRVLNRLNLCFRPGRPIPPLVSDLTGLDNQNLADQPRFSDQTVALLRVFLDQLPAPVCLLAHNARAYDVPLLRAEIRRASTNGQPVTFDYPVLDTLPALRQICAHRSKDEEGPSAHSSAGHGHPDYDDLGVRPLVDSDSELELNPEEDDITDQDLLAASVATHRETWEGAQTPSLPATPSKGFSTPLTPPTSSAKRPPTHNHRVKPTPLPFVGRPDSCLDPLDVTPDRACARSPGHNPPPPAPKRRKKVPADPASSAMNRAKKRLDFDQPPSFKLPLLHQHFLGSLPRESHGAESDCLSLLRVCATQASAILDLIPNRSQTLASAEPMW